MIIKNKWIEDAKINKEEYSLMYKESIHFKGISSIIPEKIKVCLLTKSWKQNLIP